MEGMEDSGTRDSELRQLMSIDLLLTLDLSHCSTIHIDT
jgi:hypothetical protein